MKKIAEFTKTTLIGGDLPPSNRSEVCLCFAERFEKGEGFDGRVRMDCKPRAINRLFWGWNSGVAGMVSG